VSPFSGKLDGVFGKLWRYRPVAQVRFFFLILEEICLPILDKLYVADDAAFYDLDAQNHFVRVRGDVN